jgi:hypothetical protein
LITFTISVTDFNDAITLENWEIVDTYFDWARKAVDSGGKVIFEQRNENAEPQVIMAIASQDDLDNWRTKVSNLIERIKKLK